MTLIFSLSKIKIGYLRILTTRSSPFDLDTTSVAFTVSNHLSPEVENVIMDEIHAFKNRDGVSRVPELARSTKSIPRAAYPSTMTKHKNPVVRVNVLAFFYTNDRRNELGRPLTGFTKF